MFNPSRDQVRQFFCAAWQKYCAQQPLLGAEVSAAEIAARHPEYHKLLAHPDLAMQQEWRPEGGQMNPFLHLSLHLAIHEQISIDQPPGIRAAFAALCERMERHAAEHVILECLGETLWRAQSSGTSLDAPAYLEAIERAARAD
ncbi:DUF1841 family protein [Azonexus sp.]|uniref:DUF1841 family protein n=1 Tax=Azonexus sp. TaxID=1872668 RepID=UPI0039E4800C